MESVRLAAFASGATQFITYGLLNFVVLFLMREKGMVLKQIAVYYALVVLIGVGGSMFASGRLIDRFARELNEEVVCRRRTSGDIPWSWNVGIMSPKNPPKTAQCK